MLRVGSSAAGRLFRLLSMEYTYGMSARKNLFNRVWDDHTVGTLPSGQTQLFIGQHLIHEVTSPQAFQMLRDRGLKVMFPERTLATVDHIIPTLNQAWPF